MTLADRARGCLWGLAVGDALGMPTQSMSREQIRSRWGMITGFVDGPDDQPIAPRRPAGSITDDTEQAVLLARCLIEGNGTIDPQVWADRLADWQERMVEAGSADLLGPSTRAAIAAIRAGTPVAQAGRDGTTNGAAMRIAPVGISVAIGDGVTRLVAKVDEASSPTHHTGVALAGAAAVAAAISAGIGGSTLDYAIDRARAAAALGGRRGRWVAAADIAARIGWAVQLCAGRGVAAMRDIYTLVGTGLASTESVPAAFGVLAAVPEDPWQACRMAASLGGDTDTIAAMTGAIAGAVHGLGALPAAAIEQVRRVNALDLDSLAEELLLLRART